MTRGAEGMYGERQQMRRERSLARLVVGEEGIVVQRGLVVVAGASHVMWERGVGGADGSWRLAGVVGE